MPIFALTFMLSTASLMVRSTLRCGASPGISLSNLAWSLSLKMRDSG